MVRRTTASLADLYLVDETAWLDAMAELIRTGQFSELDYPHLAEYLTDMAIRDRREVNSRLKSLLLHVLKWIHQSEMRTPSWEISVMNQQDELEDLLESGVLQNHAKQTLAASFKKALKIAIRETNLPAEKFPTECPWTQEQLLSEVILNHGG